VFVFAEARTRAVALALLEGGCGGETTEGRGVIGIGPGIGGVVEVFGAEDGKEGRDGDEDAELKVLGYRMGLLVHFAELEREMDDGTGAGVEGACPSSQAPLPSSTSSSLAWLMTAISQLRAFSPSSMNIRSLSRI